MQNCAKYNKNATNAIVVMEKIFKFSRAYVRIYKRLLINVVSQMEAAVDNDLVQIVDGYA